MRSSLTLFALALAPVALASVGQGHPVPLRFAAGAGLTYTSGSISIADEIVHFCDDTTQTYDVDEIVDIGDPIVLPPGEICGVELVLDAPIALAGTGSGGTFSLGLDAGTIVLTLDPSLTVSQQETSDADFVELASPDWITATSLQMQQGVHRSVTYGHTLHAQLRGDVLGDSAILR